jgi:hypothetical protein
VRLRTLRGRLTLNADETSATVELDGFDRALISGIQGERLRAHLEERGWSAGYALLDATDPARDREFDTLPDLAAALVDAGGRPLEVVAVLGGVWLLPLTTLERARAGIS